MLSALAWLAFCAAQHIDGQNAVYASFDHVAMLQSVARPAITESDERAASKRLIAESVDALFAGDDFWPFQAPAATAPSPAVATLGLHTHTRETGGNANADAQLDAELASLLGWGPASSAPSQHTGNAEVHAGTGADAHPVALVTTGAEDALMTSSAAEQEDWRLAARAREAFRLNAAAAAVVEADNPDRVTGLPDNLLPSLTALNASANQIISSLPSAREGSVLAEGGNVGVDARAVDAVSGKTDLASHNKVDIETSSAAEVDAAAAGAADDVWSFMLADAAAQAAFAKSGSAGLDISAVDMTSKQSNVANDNKADVDTASSTAVDTAIAETAGTEAEADVDSAAVAAVGIEDLAAVAGDVNDAHGASADSIISHVEASESSIVGGDSSQVDTSAAFALIISNSAVDVAVAEAANAGLDTRAVDTTSETSILGNNGQLDVSTGSSAEVVGAVTRTADIAANAEFDSSTMATMNAEDSAAAAADVSAMLNVAVDDSAHVDTGSSAADDAPGLLMPDIVADGPLAERGMSSGKGDFPKNDTADVDIGSSAEVGGAVTSTVDIKAKAKVDLSGVDTVDAEDAAAAAATVGNAQDASADVIIRDLDITENSVADDDTAQVGNGSNFAVDVPSLVASDFAVDTSEGSSADVDTSAVDTTSKRNDLTSDSRADVGAGSHTEADAAFAGSADIVAHAQADSTGVSTMIIDDGAVVADVSDALVPSTSGVTNNFDIRQHSFADAHRVQIETGSDAADNAGDGALAEDGNAGLDTSSLDNTGNTRNLANNNKVKDDTTSSAEADTAVKGKSDIESHAEVDFAGMAIMDTEDGAVASADVTDVLDADTNGISSNFDTTENSSDDVDSAQVDTVSNAVVHASAVVRTDIAAKEGIDADSSTDSDSSTKGMTTYRDGMANVNREIVDTSSADVSTATAGTAGKAYASVAQVASHQIKIEIDEAKVGHTSAYQLGSSIPKVLLRINTATDAVVGSGVAASAEDRSTERDSGKESAKIDINVDGKIDVEIALVPGQMQAPSASSMSPSTQIGAAVAEDSSKASARVDVGSNVAVDAPALVESGATADAADAEGGVSTDSDTSAAETASEEGTLADNSKADVDTGSAAGVGREEVLAGSAKEAPAAAAAAAAEAADEEAQAAAAHLTTHLAHTRLEEKARSAAPPLVYRLGKANRAMHSHYDFSAHAVPHKVGHHKIPHFHHR